MLVVLLKDFVTRDSLWKGLLPILVLLVGEQVEVVTELVEEFMMELVKVLVMGVMLLVLILRGNFAMLGLAEDSWNVEEVWV